MANTITDLTTKGLLVKNAATNKLVPIEPIATHKFLQNIISIQDFTKKYTRTGGGLDAKTGIITYVAFPKQTESRDGKITYDVNGKIIDGWYGKQDGTNTIKLNMEHTYGMKIAKTTLRPLGFAFMSHIYNTKEMSVFEEYALVNKKIIDFSNQELVKQFNKLRQAFVNVPGKVGELAKNSGFTDADLPKSGVGKRMKTSTFTSAEALIKEIKDTLRYKEKIGNDVENKYPFIYQFNLSNTVIVISSEMNELLLAHISNSNNGFIAGLGSNKETGLITYISVDGKMIPVNVEPFLPQRDSKDVNYMILEVGEHGAIAIPTLWENSINIVPCGLVEYDRNLQMTAMKVDIGGIQPELAWMSLKG